MKFNKLGKYEIRNCKMEKKIRGKENSRKFSEKTYPIK